MGYFIGLPGATASSEIIEPASASPSPSSPRTHATNTPDLALESVNRLVRKALLKLYGPSASFRSVSQELAIYQALARDVHLMLIFPTRTRQKSFISIAAIIEAQHTTVLFVPLQLVKLQFGGSEIMQYPIATWRSNYTLEIWPCWRKKGLLFTISPERHD